MRKLARVAIVIIVVGLCTMPMLHGRKPAAGDPGRAALQVHKFAFQIGGWGSGIKLSEPGLLLVVGLGLMVSAGRLPAVLRIRSRLQQVQSKRRQGQRGRLPNEDRANQNALLKFGPSPQSQSSWPEQSRASNGTLG